LRRFLLTLPVFLVLTGLLVTGTCFAANYYKVQAGDTLFLISKKYGLTPKILMEVNNLKTDVIWPGQNLVIPMLQNYIVRPGDTLYKIARARGISVQSLMGLNRLRSTVIYPGQVLLVPEAVASKTTTASRLGLTSKDIYLLAQLIHAEARGEPFVGQVAVGAVVLNRVLDPRFPQTVKDVIFQYWNGIPQFEPVYNGQIYLPPDQSALRAAYAAISGWDPTNGALYFYNPQKSKSTFFNKFLTLVCRIGNHVFYR